MEMDRLSHLALLCIKHAFINRVDIEKAVGELLSEKVRSNLFSTNFYTKQRE